MKPRIDISEFSDFCFGVKRAISLAEEALGKHSGPVFSLGPIIHNRQVVGELSKKGLKVADSLENFKKGTLVIRSHGITSGQLDRGEKERIDIVDATCPFVKNGQMLVRKLSKEGYKVIIVGDKGHPEVKSLKSFSSGKAAVVTNKNEARRLRLKNDKAGIIAQTTQSPEDFHDIIAELMRKEFSEIRVFNTICRDTNMRQEATKKCAKENDLVIVVGGKNSANTRKLYKICKKMGRESYHIETGREVKKKWLKAKKTIGIVSGASTPRWIVDGVVDRLKSVR